jgi:hypothetical protein
LEGLGDALLCHLCGVFTIDSNPTHHAHGNRQTLVSRLGSKPLWMPTDKSMSNFVHAKQCGPSRGWAWNIGNLLKTIDEGFRLETQ